MSWKRKPACVKFMAGASVLALGMSAQVAFAQDAEEATAEEDGPEIIVSGIRASLQQSMNIKRNAQGVVDAISAEDIGKFPDTNLAESLQRITGVSIDRASGEGSTVTVRGFGPDFNLVVLNGRQMPASGLGSCCEAPASRSFDFGNLASEGIAGVEVYKSGRASLPTGGIGSVINIKTAKPLDRPGLQGSIGVKGVIDNTFDGTEITPELSGIVSQTFADGKVGILVSGSYQNRKASLAQFNAGWREGYTPNTDAWSWGGLANGDPNDWRAASTIENGPQGDDIYQTTQNAGYDFTDIERERINGQAVLQFAPTDSLTATVDYTYAQNTIDARTNSIGVWFNHNITQSSWTDGPVAGPNFYGETFGAGENKDLAITGAVAANRTILQSLGGNLAWDNGGLRLELDAHRSTSESKPTSPYGSNIAVGSAVYGVESQRVDYTSDMPVISVNMYPGSEVQASNIRPAGNAFRNAYMKDTITEFTFRAGYDFDSSFIESIDFGATYIENKVRSAFGVIQNDTWGGTLSAAETPDDLYEMTNLPNDLAGMSGSNDPSIIPNYFKVSTEELIGLLDTQLGICSNAQVAGTCLAAYTTDRRIKEKTLAPYIQSTHEFDLGDAPATLRLGLRYEETEIDSSALVPIPTGVVWVADNEMNLVFGGGSDFTTLEGKYDNWLPAIDFSIEPFDNVVLRASYSHTITRPDYTSMQGGLTVNQPLRPLGGSTASSGNPGLLPYKSKNVDLSAEWYYGNASYVSVGFFSKNVSNFIASAPIQGSLFDLPNPAQGAAVEQARAALGGNPGFSDILNWLDANNPSVVQYNGAGAPTGIIGQAADPDVVFTITQPANSDDSAHLTGWEFAVQHNFWETGFGVILNYTVVNSDSNYDNTLQFLNEQFAVTGVSDSANAVLYYDKSGIQARVAYNWRDEFLAGYGFDPFYVESYGQVDASASYEFGNGLTVFVEGINLLNEDRRGHQRADQAVFFAAPGYARYAGGVRFSF